MAKEFGALRGPYTVAVRQDEAGLPVELEWDGDNQIFIGVDTVDGIRR